MSERDYYEVLGVERTADAAALRKAYRSLAMKHHPDRNPDDAVAEKKFKEAKGAYEVLSDEKKRAAYDRFGHAGVSGAAQAGQAHGRGDFGDIFGDIFGDVFGGGRGGRSTRGADLQHVAELSFEQAVQGTKVVLNVPGHVHCETCQGSGAKAGTSPVRCHKCEGKGQIRMQQGFFSVQQTCPQCRGSGQFIEDPCGTCRGAGVVKQTRKISVTIPAGVDNDDVIRVRGEGQPGETGSDSGDLLVVVRVKPHAVFERHQSNLLCQMSIGFTLAALGGTLDVPTLDGFVSLKIPAGTQSEKVFRLRGKGVKSVRGGATGDLLCRVHVEVPVNLNKAQKQLLQQLADSLDGGTHNPQASSWRDRAKKFIDGLSG